MADALNLPDTVSALQAGSSPQSGASVSSVLNWLMGRPEPLAGPVPMPQPNPLRVTEHQAEPLGDYPNVFDVNSSLQNDLSYGDPAARFLEPGKASITEVPRSTIKSWFEDPRGFLLDKKKAVPVDANMADELHRAWIASRNSAISELGFKPQQTAASPPGQWPRFNVAGAYEKTSDTSWWDRNHPSALVHEGLHRGLRMMRDQQLYDPTKYPDEELLVRALMLRNFGDIETREAGGSTHKQIDLAKTFVEPKHLDELEDIAAQYRARKRPMGPR